MVFALLDTTAMLTRGLVEGTDITLSLE
jgi:hypothetical protein